MENFPDVEFVIERRLTSLDCMSEHDEMLTLAFKDMAASEISQRIRWEEDRN